MLPADAHPPEWTPAPASKWQIPNSFQHKPDHYDRPGSRGGIKAPRVGRKKIDFRSNFFLRASSKRHTHQLTEEPMLFARVQDQLANITASAAMWSCCVSAAASGNREGRAYRLARTTAAFSKQFAHRGSVSSLCVAKPGRLGNPEDTP
jgi:hypothetical protein